MNMDQLREDAYRTLLESVKQLSVASRVTVAAAVKPRMKRLDPNFDEKLMLGFPSFKSFLDSARARGLIDLRPTPGGDLMILLPQPKAATSQSPTESSRRRIRSDLWTAFVDWSQGYLRLYDRDTSKAHVISHAPTALDPDVWIRQQLQITPDRFIAIEPIGRDVQDGWMREFTEGLDNAPGARQLLAEALGSPARFQAFVQTIHTLGLTHSWHSWRLSKVGTHIDEWAARNNVMIDAFETPAPLRAAPSLSEGLTSIQATAQVGEGEFDLETVRTTMHRAIDKMGLADLLRLPIPAEHLLRRG